ncbi:MAG: DUF2779 domain-containing protein [Alkalispirochaeta sp.]
MYLSPADLLLWRRCRRQWLNQCYPLGPDGKRTRRPALPVEMTGEAQLRETARVITDAFHRQRGRAESIIEHVSMIPGDLRTAPAVAVLPVAVLHEGYIDAWAEATRRAILEKRPFLDGILVDRFLVALVDFGYYHEKVGGWEISLARPATGVRGIYFTEASILAAIAEAHEIPLAGIHLYYLTKNTASAAPDAPGPYLESNVLKRARKGTAQLSEDVAALVETIDGGGEIDPGYRCSAKCDLCVPRGTNGPDRYSPLTLHKGGDLARELIAAGITDLRDEALSLRKLTKKQRIQVESVRSDLLHIDTDRVRRFLEDLAYPLFFLDFEAFAPALPPFQGLSPYQHTPVLVSVHRETRPGSEPEGFVHACTPGSDGRNALFQWLRDLVGETGTIVVFSRPFETAMIRQLGNVAGDTAGADNLVGRVVDLLEPFSEFLVYHPEQRGKVSLKRVLPVFTDHAGYGESRVKDGMHANLGFMRLHDRAVIAAGRGDRETAAAAAAEEATQIIERFGPSGATRLPTVEEIEAYCAVDTIAMYHLVERLRELCREPEELPNP